MRLLCVYIQKIISTTQLGFLENHSFSSNSLPQQSISILLRVKANWGKSR
jgi:hypothetical protein